MGKIQRMRLMLGMVFGRWMAGVEEFRFLYG